MEKAQAEKIAQFEQLKAQGFTAEHAKQYIHAYKNALKEGVVPENEKPQAIAAVKFLLEYVEWLSK